MIGYGIGIIELVIYFSVSYFIRRNSASLKDINAVSYYWFTMTVLTFIWEVSFVLQYKSVSKLGGSLIMKNETVWTNNYDLSYVLPWKLSRIFYAEYGAHADREYLALDGDWSRVIESSHAVFCGLFSLFASVIP